MTGHCPHCGHPDNAGTRLWTPDELAHRWEKPAPRIRGWIRDGLLSSQRIGRHHYIPSLEVDRFEAATPPTEVVSA